MPVNKILKFFSKSSTTSDTTSGTTPSPPNHDDDDDAIMKMKELNPVQKAFLQTEEPLNMAISGFLCPSLSPLKQQQDRIIMIYEAYTLFGALFLNAVWFIWEYGISKEFENVSLERIFEITCALNMFSNLCITTFGAFAWSMAILYSNSIPNNFYSQRNVLLAMVLLANIGLWSTIISMLIAMWNRMKDYTIDASVVVSLAFVIFFSMLFIILKMVPATIPLEMYHTSMVFRPWASCMGEQRLKEKAQERANFIKKHVIHTPKQEEAAGGSTELFVPTTDGMKDVEKLLKAGCDRLGKKNADNNTVDVTPYLKKLQLDWYDNISSLKGESVEILSKYMPRMLAKTVHEILLEQQEQQQERDSD